MKTDDALKIADLSLPTLSRETLLEACKVLASDVRGLRIAHRSNHKTIEYWRSAVKDARAACAETRSGVGLSGS